MAVVVCGVAWRILVWTVAIINGGIFLKILKGYEMRELWAGESWNNWRREEERMNLTEHGEGGY